MSHSPRGYRHLVGYFCNIQNNYSFQCIVNKKYQTFTNIPTFFFFFFWVGMGGTILSDFVNILLNPVNGLLEAQCL